MYIRCASVATAAEATVSSNTPNLIYVSCLRQPKSGGRNYNKSDSQTMMKGVLSGEGFLSEEIHIVLFTNLFYQFATRVRGSENTVPVNLRFDGRMRECVVSCCAICSKTGDVATEEAEAVGSKGSPYLYISCTSSRFDCESHSGHDITTRCLDCCGMWFCQIAFSCGSSTFDPQFAH